ncbi:cytochrome P450 [Flammula alnicola]|nr:cytochrome P450 [Flammula alnicola]
MISTATSYSILFTFLAAYLLVRRRRKSSGTLLPPGPKGYPLIGNVYDIPHDHAWLTYAEWAKTYGDVMSTNVFGTTTIILNSLKATTELLDKRSSNYSDRPKMIMANELMDWDWDFAHMPYTDRWRRHRRMFHQYFQPRNLSAYYPVQKKTTLNLLEQLGRSPEQFSAHVRQYVGSVALRAAYGYEVKAENDFYIDLVHKAVTPLLLVVHAGNYLVDYLPFLKHIPTWFPGAYFKKEAELWAKDTRNLRDIPFDRVKQLMANGIAEQSFVYDNLEKIKADNKASPEEEDIIRNCAGIVYLAGSDTTASALLGWMLAMANYPEVQSKAQAEIDNVIGSSRLPDFSDRPSLPYLEATLLETMRWHAITPLSLPHRAIHEDEYNGYKIPAGKTTLLTSITYRAILHDEELYPAPFQFKPERFLQEEGRGVQPDPTNIGSFGFGRRICPGRHLASNSAWIAMAYILSTYNISKAVDADGKVVEPLVKFTDGLVSHPEAYKVQIAPRSERTIKLIESTMLTEL